MTAYTKSERADYNLHRDNVCRGLGITHNQYNWLRRKGEELHKQFENDCNGLYSEEQAQCLFEDVSDKVDSYVKKLGLFVYYQTDPRGATIYVAEKQLTSQDYNQGYCIY